MLTVAANAPAAREAERMKSRREKAFADDSRRSDMRRPTLFVLASPHFHRVGVTLDSAVLRVKVQFAVDLPCNVGKLEHGDGHIPDGNRSVQFLALTDSCDEVGEVSVGHGIAPQQVS